MATNLIKEELLAELGLSKNDSLVYLTLLREGKNNPTVISKKSGIFRANVYGSLERLKVKGLVSEINEDKKRFFQASNPNALLTLLKEKELRLKSILPELVLDHQLAQKNEVEVYNNIAALRNLFHHYLELGDDIYSYGVPKIAVNLVGEYFQNVIHKKRAQQKQWMYHIYNSDAKERVNYLNSLPYTKTRSLPPEFDCPVATVICGDEINIAHYKKDKCMIIVIKNKDIANAYKKYFQVLWNKAKE